MEGPNCKYRKFLNDYSVLIAGKIDEKVLLGYEKQEYFKKQYSKWLHIKNLGLGAGQWSPCEYFDQLSKAMVASHSIFNYSIFLSLLPNRNLLPARHLLILDEAHLVERDCKIQGGYPYLRRGGKGISKILKLLIMVTTLMVG